ncbi:MAG: hypothetical protein KF685_02850 [Acidobacteria bacterium]|nr:hypothetical protein [Acidobacteriota bacterium]
MLYYVLICICLVLTGIAGLQMSYMLYLDRLDRERKERLKILERRCRRLTNRLEAAERQLEEQELLLSSVYEPDEEDDGSWADVIEDP